MNDIDILKLKSAELRGSIIEDTIYLERLMDEFLCNYFCDDAVKKNQLFELLMSSKKITFNSKSQILAEIASKNPELGVTSKEILKEFDILAKERNIFAHYLLDTSDEGVAQYKSQICISYLNFINKKEKQKISYTNKELDDIYSLQVKYIKILGDFLVKVQNEQSPRKS